MAPTPAVSPERKSKEEEKVQTETTNGDLASVADKVEELSVADSTESELGMNELIFISQFLTTI